MRHLIAILLQNEAGALTRVTGLFSSRGYNIESLSVAPTNDPTVSRITLVTVGSDAVIAQINAIGNLAGFVGPFLLGYIKDATGSYALGLLPMILLAVVAAIAVLIMGRQPAGKHQPARAGAD